MVESSLKKKSTCIFTMVHFFYVTQKIVYIDISVTRYTKQFKYHFVYCRKCSMVHKYCWVLFAGLLSVIVFCQQPEDFLNSNQKSKVNSLTTIYYFSGKLNLNAICLFILQYSNLDMKYESFFIALVYCVCFFLWLIHTVELR